MPSEDECTFGQMVKAARLGFHWHARMRAFVRISDDLSNDRWIVNIQNADSMQNLRKVKPENHRCWWEGGDDPLRLTELSKIVRIKRPCILTLSDDGRIVGRSAA